MRKRVVLRIHRPPFLVYRSQKSIHGHSPSGVGNKATTIVSEPIDNDKEIVMNQGQIQFANTKWMTSLTVALICLLVPLAANASGNDAEQARVKASGDVLKELLNGPNGVPLSVLNKAECVIVLPSVKKAGFIVGAEYGRGVMTCRSGENFDSSWSAPVMMQSSGGSFGLQAGGEATDFVILVMNAQGRTCSASWKSEVRC